MTATQPTAEEVAQAVKAYNERYAGMDEAMWQRSQQVRALFRSGVSVDLTDRVEDFVWRVKKWGSIQGVSIETRPVVAVILATTRWDSSLFDESSSFGADAERLAVDRVSELVREMAARGVPRQEFSLASKVLHWILPWRICVYDRIVRKALGIQVIGAEAYRHIVRWQFAAGAALITSGVDWLGTVEPRSPLRALDKYVWWVGGGKDSRATVVRNL